MSGDTHAMAIRLQMFSQRHERLHITYDYSISLAAEVPLDPTI